MAVGPCELIIARFPGNQFKGEIVPALASLVEAGTIKIIDLLFAIKDDKGEMAIVELKDIDGDGTIDLVEVVEISGAIGPEDVDAASELIEPNSSALLILFEHTWAAELAQAFRNAAGEVVYMERIPAAAVEEAITAATA